jgi:hypothetical protein
LAKAHAYSALSALRALAAATAPLSRVMTNRRAATSRRPMVSTGMPCKGLKYGPRR